MSGGPGSGEGGGANGGGDGRANDGGDGHANDGGDGHTNDSGGDGHANDGGDGHTNDSGGNGHADGGNNGHADGGGNGHANGGGNGHADGGGNGHANGGGNGNGNGGAGRTKLSDPLRAMEPFPTAHMLLDKYGLRAKKSFGQNFLISERAFRAIVDATVKSDEDWIVEIGAGLGTLTMRLAERLTAGKLIALEADPDMVRVLRGELAGVDNVEIEHVDALRYDLRMAAKWRGEPIAVCGNLPYHIASQLLFKIIDARESVTHAVVMIQKEMADRIVAPPGGKDYGAIGVMLRTYADVTTVAKVGAGSFVPAPKIDSTVIRLVPLPRPRTEITNAQHYSAVVHAAFGQRRKTLRNALRAVFDEAAVDAALAATEIDGGRRGETLDISEFGALARAIPAR